MTPQMVYSGLIDAIKYELIDDSTESSLENALKESDTFLAYNITSNQLTEYTDLAIKLGLKRVVFAVKVNENETKENILFENETSKLKNSGILYTIIKYLDTIELGESKQSYRIVRGELPFNNENPNEILASKDLLRVSKAHSL